MAASGPALPGGELTWTLTATNAGPSDGEEVSLSDRLSLAAGESVISAVPDSGTCTTTGLGTVSCGLGTLKAGTTTKTAVVQSVSPGRTDPLDDEATVTSQTYDPNPANNTASAAEPVELSATASIASPASALRPETASSDAQVSGTGETPDPSDLALALSAAPVFVSLGGSVTFTLTLTNNGPDPATGVTVEDALSPGLGPVSASPSQGSYDFASGAWTVGSLADLASVTLSIDVSANAGGTITDRASIRGADQPDPDPANNSSSATILVGVSTASPSADVGITKQVDNPSPPVGGQVNFTITMTNHGPDASTSTQGQDRLPPGLRFVSAAGDGVYDPGSGRWNGDLAMANGQSRTLIIAALVVAPGCFTNTASVLFQAETDPNPANNSAGATVCASAGPGQADLGISLSVDNSRPNVGDTVTLTALLHNSGPDQATGVTVGDPVPAGLSFLSAAASQGTFNAAAGLWTAGSLVNGASATLAITARVVTSTLVTSDVSIAGSAQADPDTSNNTATITLNPQRADLMVGKGVSNPAPNVGDTITYIIILGDLGPDPATGVTVSDKLPAGLSFLFASPSQGTYDAASGTWTVGSVSAGSSATLTLFAQLVSANPVTNNVSISHSDQFDVNAANNAASVTITPLQADLAVAKSVDNSTPNVGGTVSFLVSVGDNGPDSATGVTVSDSLPAGLSFVSAIATQGAYNATTGLWTVGSIAKGSTQALSITVTVTSAAAATNTASISHSDQFDSDPTNNTASVSLTPQQADLAVFKTVSDPTPNVGDTITYTVRVVDDGPDSATNVSLGDVLPGGVSFVSASPSQGSYDPTSGVWSVGTVPPGQAETLALTALVTALGPAANTAAIVHSDQFDPDLSNNSDTASVNPDQADLEITKSVDNPAPNVGDEVTFTVTTTNDGPSSATGVTVTDVLPSGLAFVSASPGQGSYTPSTGAWVIGSVPDGASVVLVLVAQVASAAEATNTAALSHSDQVDPNPGNDASSATVVPQQADLAVGESVSSPTPNVGDTITVFIPLGNLGPAAATNVALTDLLPSGLAFVSASPSQGTYEPTAGLWMVGSLPAGQPALLAITARVVAPGAQTNTAAVAHSDQFDPNLSNNQATATVTPQQADLAVTKTVTDATPNVGDTVVFTVSLTDDGPNDATDVEVSDLLPGGLSFVASSSDQGGYDPATGLWTVGTVSAGATVSLTIAAQVGPGASSNTASISHSDQFDPDLSNAAASVAIAPQQADLTVTKTVDDSHPEVGQTVVFTIVVANNGPYTATAVTLLDALPAAGLAFVTASPDEGSYDPAQGIWTVGTISVGAQASLTVRAQVVQAGTFTNTVSLSQADQFDPDPSNDTASATVMTASIPTPSPPPAGPGTSAHGSNLVAGSHSGAAPGGETQASNERLPVTGAPVGRLALVAVCLIVVGEGLHVWARERRSRSRGMRS